MEQTEMKQIDRDVRTITADHFNGSGCGQRIG